MKPYLFAVGVVLMLSFSLAGLVWTAAMALRRLFPECWRLGPLTALAIGTTLLVILITVLSWSVPPGGGVA
ncbi:hypothetical protein [Paraburkholderia bonniea]|uniref:hypothetical protein n=1 Tax=Paraburkholderia bonniea TaxID=2152891 RepID=UPI001291B70A|nr:hypothetical protein [Paraburkholderia bonniea]